MLLDSVNKITKLPSRIEEVEQIKILLPQPQCIIQHCYREINQTTDRLRLASRSHDTNNNTFFASRNKLPPHFNGLITLDRWNTTKMHIANKNKIDIVFEPHKHLFSFFVFWAFTSYQLIFLIAILYLNGDQGV